MPGLVTFTSNAQIDAEEQRRLEQQAALERQNAPVVQGLAAHVRACWDAAKLAKDPIEDLMLRALRQRNGEYEPDKLAAIREQGGSEIYMMITETKCRGAESWLRDILLDEGHVPFALRPTPVQDMPPEVQDDITQGIAERVISAVQQGIITPDAMRDFREQAEADVRDRLASEAQDRADRMQKQIMDQFHEGGMLQAFDAFLCDLSTYPFAVLKGPVVKRVKQLDWTVENGRSVPKVSEKLAPTYYRVDPFRFFWEPGITRLQDGYVIEHHRLSRSDLADLIGVPGYDDSALRYVLENMGGMTEWLNTVEWTKAPLEGKHSTWSKPVLDIDALEFWGRVSGRMLLEWGLTPEQVPDPDKEYDANVWLIGHMVIKATLNFDPLADKPYRMTSFFKKPGALTGSGVPEVIEDVQAMCNACARALSNNMGLASGPQVEVNVERLADGEKVTKLRPWRQWQVVNDPMGSGQPAVRFEQPNDNSQNLMNVYREFARMADDQSGIPAYVYGDGQVGGAGRTASGLSMLMGSAGKGIRQVIMHIDFDVIGTLVTAQYNWNMRYLEDESLKGDCEIVPRGAVTLANREQLNVRRVEFLQATANPLDAQILGTRGRAAILREVAKGLGMPTEDLIPSDFELDQIERVQQQVAQEEAAAGGEPGSTLPDGSPAGGRQANVVSNQQTGRGG